MNQEDFNKFQLSEYQFIAQAHFETIKQVTEFFRYYLIILSASAIIFVLFDHNIETLQQFLNGSFIFVSKIISSFFIILSFVGLFLCIYIINLRQDAILYARTVNGIRKYFFESKIFLSEEFEKYFRVMTKNITQPSYLEWHIFFPVVFTFSLLNTVYLSLGLYLRPNGFIKDFIYIKIPLLALPTLYLVLIGFFTLHTFLYVYLAYWRDNTYMRSHKIGIDIDGVLNDHKKHFCNLLQNNLSYNRLSPDDIIKIPVRHISGRGITETDELKVFNDVKYWEEMLPIQNNFNSIHKIKKQCLID